MSASTLSPHYGLHQQSAKQVNSPPPSPLYIDSKPCFDDKTLASSTLTSLDDDNGPVDIRDAKKAVCLAGYPDSIVQLVIDYHSVHYGTQYKSVNDLFFDVEDVVKHPYKQQLYARTIHLSEQSEKGAAEKQVVKLDDSASKPHTEVVEKPVQLKDKMRTLSKENKMLRKRKMCRACEKVELATSGMTFLPCGHFITCEECAEKYDDCPACGKKILGTVRTFLS